MGGLNISMIQIKKSNCKKFNATTYIKPEHIWIYTLSQLRIEWIYQRLHQGTDLDKEIIRYSNPFAFKYCTIYGALSIYHDHYSSNNSRETPYSSPVKVSYGVSIMCARSDWSFTIKTVALCALSSYVWPRYITSLWYQGHFQSWSRGISAYRSVLCIHQLEVSRHIHVLSWTWNKQRTPIRSWRMYHYTEIHFSLQSPFPGLNATFCFLWFTNCVLLFDKNLILGCLWLLVFVLNNILILGIWCSTIPHLPGCFCPWTFFENIGFNTMLTDPFMSHLATQLG